MEGILSVLYLVGAFGLPVLLYVVNRRTLGIRFRFLGLLSVGLTGLVLTIFSVLVVVPLIEQALEAEGRVRVEDTDSHVLGSMISGVFWGIIGTMPLALYHSLWKRRQRSGIDAGAGPVAKR